ncbi:hypothetical protein N6H14_09190 [Paenibacillus sp. CC-CFT747]|nr:hypothetical protein N6H14_09190 [Paenibacillus sp. CC-CFT747]
MVTASLEEKEIGSGRYEGAWALPEDARRVLSLKGSLTIRTAAAEKEALAAPLPVGGILTISADTPYWDPIAGAVVTIYSPSLGLSDAKLLQKTGVTFPRLPPAADYVIGLRSKEGYSLLEGAGPAAETAAGKNAG